MKGNIKKIILISLPALTFVVPVLLYVLFLKGRVAEMLAYEGGQLWTVIVIGAVCAAFVYVLSDKLFSSFTVQEDDEEELQWEEDAFEREENENSLAMEEYPELFSKREAEDETEAVPSYRESLKKAFDACREQEITEDTTPDSNEVEEDRSYFDSFVCFEKKEEARGLYDDIPCELPEGYVPFVEDSEEEEEEEGVDEEAYETPAGALRYGAVLVMCILISFVSAFACSFSYTGVSRDGVFLSSMFSQKEYKWSDAKNYSVDTTFFGKLRITVTMKDGAEAEIVPHSLNITDVEEGGFESLYEYAAFADEKLSGLGAQKSIENEDAIVREYENRDDGAFEYVKKILDMENEHDG